MADLTDREHSFQVAADLLDTAGILWWLSDGSALGCVREGRFLATDHDMDLGCWACDLPYVRDILAGRGLGKVRRDMPGQVQVRRPGVKFDVHGHTRDGNRVWFPLGGSAQWRYVFDGRLFDEFEEHTFYGRTVLVPAPSADYLEAHYGPDWRTPKGGWRWDSSPPCLAVVG